jgi:hypothetical protein
MSAAYAPCAVPKMTAASRSLRIATLHRHNLVTLQSSPVNLNQSLSGEAIDTHLTHFRHARSHIRANKNGAEHPRR